MQREYGHLIIISMRSTVLRYGCIGGLLTIHEWIEKYSYIFWTSVDSGESINYIEFITIVASHKEVALGLNM